MARELLAFANFNFEISEFRTKVIIGDGVQEEDRYSLNWGDYLNELEEAGIDLAKRGRPFFVKYETPRPDPHYFDDFLAFQRKFILLLSEISQERRISEKLWELIFREAEKLTEVITFSPPVSGGVGERELQELSFEKQTTAETYRTCLFGLLRDLIMEKKIFRIRRCPECGLFFWDNTKNANKIYCSAEKCGNRAKQRAYLERRTGRGQSKLTF